MLQGYLLPWRPCLCLKSLLPWQDRAERVAESEVFHISQCTIKSGMEPMESIPQLQTVPLCQKCNRDYTFDIDCCRSRCQTETFKHDQWLLTSLYSWYGEGFGYFLSQPQHYHWRLTSLYFKIILFFCFSSTPFCQFTIFRLLTSWIPERQSMTSKTRFKRLIFQVQWKEEQPGTLITNIEVSKMPMRRWQKYPA